MKSILPAITTAKVVLAPGSEVVNTGHPCDMAILSMVAHSRFYDSQSLSQADDVFDTIHTNVAPSIDQPRSFYKGSSAGPHQGWWASVAVGGNYPAVDFSTSSCGVEARSNTNYNQRIPNSQVMVLSSLHKTAAW